MRFIQWKMLTVRAIIAIFSISACTNLKSNSNDSIIEGELGTKLDTTLTPFIENKVSSYDIPGVAIGVVKDNAIVYAKAFGYLNSETEETIKLNSLFHMASISKPFVATAIMQLVEQNKIHLDSTVVSYLPYFKLDDEQYKNITIRHMLNHTSGMPDVRDYQWNKPEYDKAALENYVRSISSNKLLSIPGEKFAYSNMAFECLGDVIAKVSGMSFAEYVKKNILNPSGMKESTFLKPDSLPKNWAAPHTRILTSEVSDVYPYNRRHGPSSTLHSNILEMCNWARINLNKGTYNENTILNPESYEKLWNPWFQTGEESYVGLSWFLRKFKDENTIGHSGGDVGFRTDLVMLPEKNIALIVLCNLNPSPVGEIKNAALDIILGIEPTIAPSPASVPVFKELEQNGLDSAVALWDSLKTNHSKAYDFHPRHFVALFIAMNMERVDDSKMIASLCVSIFPENVLNNFTNAVKNYYSNNPDNKAAPEILEIFEEKSNP